MRIFNISFCFLGLISLLYLPTANGADLLFSDDFEDRDLSGWTSLRAVLSTNVAHSGKYSVKVTHDETALNIKNFNLDTMLQYPEIMVKFWWYTAPSWVLGTGVKWMRLRGPDQIIQLELWFTEKLGNESLGMGGFMYGKDGGDYGYLLDGVNKPIIYGASQSYNKGKWMQFILYYKLNAVGKSDGFLKFSVDGIEKYNKINYRFRNTNTAFVSFYIPSNIGTPSINCVNYIDDVEIWGGDNLDSQTPEPGVPTPTITDILIIKDLGEERYLLDNP